MAAFNKAGGRLFRIALTFTIVSILVLGVMAYFTRKAMVDIKELALYSINLEENQSMMDTQAFYSRLIENLKFGTVLGSLSGVLIAIAARYGLRETSKNIGDGMKSKSEVSHSVDSDGSSKTEVSEEVGK
jgi:hypothetical protein